MDMKKLVFYCGVTNSLLMVRSVVPASMLPRDILKFESRGVLRWVYGPVNYLKFPKVSPPRLFSDDCSVAELVTRVRCQLGSTLG